MERSQRPASARQTDRQLSHLKLISRLLSHELRAQNSPRVTLSREEVHEIQTALDLYIEEIQRRSKGTGQQAAAPAASELEVRAMPTRVN